MIQLYGHFHDPGSFGNISFAVAKALKGLGVGALGYSIGAADSCPLPMGMNNRAPIAIAIGYPQQAIGWLRGHDYRIMMTVCESAPIPGDWVKACNEASVIVVPSEFCRQTFVDSGVRSPVVVVRHGVSYAGVRSGAGEGEKPPRFLHVTGAASFPWRKGTAPLLLAWEALGDTSAELVIRAPALRPQIEAVVGKFGLKNISFDSSDWNDPVARTKAIASYDAVIQPSRGEGFGMVPLEAKCLSIPAIFSAATGHMEYYNKNFDVGIECGRATHTQTQGNDQGIAPTVPPENILKALNLYLRHRSYWTTQAVKWAKEEGPKWRWQEVLKPLVKLVRENLLGANRGIILGAEASLRGSG